MGVDVNLSTASRSRGKLIWLVLGLLLSLLAWLRAEPQHPTIAQPREQGGEKSLPKRVETHRGSLP